MREPFFKPDTQSWHTPLDSPQQVAHDVEMAFARDRDGKVRDRLIELGWLPPDQVATVRRALAEAIEAAVRKGVTVKWEALAAQLIAAHDALPKQST